MATIATPEQVTEIYKNSEKDFKSGLMSIHNLLWQIIVNEVGAERNYAFATVYDAGNHYLTRVEAGQPGYYNSYVEFADHHTYESALEVCEYLNKAVYGLDRDQMMAMIDQSFQIQLQSY